MIHPRKAALALIVLVCGAAGAARAQEEERAPAVVGPSPVGVLASLEEGWRTGNGDAVLDCLSRREVELAFGRTGPGGTFDRAQAGFLIADLLHYGENLGFRIVRFEWEKDKPPRAVAEWVHRMETGEMRDSLEIELAAENELWRVVRIATR